MQRAADALHAGAGVRVAGVGEVDETHGESQELVAATSSQMAA
jgi:hypothetical protein